MIDDDFSVGHGYRNDELRELESINRELQQSKSSLEDLAVTQQEMLIMQGRIYEEMCQANHRLESLIDCIKWGAIAIAIYGGIAFIKFS